MAQDGQDKALRVIAFDVFGTVVDWYGGIKVAAEATLPGVDGGAFALAWRARYQPAMQAAMRTVAQGGAFTRLDELHLAELGPVLEAFGHGGASAGQRQALVHAWHTLPAWPDAVAGLARLKERYTICTLSNGNIGLLTDMAKNARLPWDCILSAENFGAYKPSPKTYLGVADIFGVAPGQVMLAAAHVNDLKAARGCGLQTAFIHRPHEFGPGSMPDMPALEKGTYRASAIDQLVAVL